jgi:hypothetical protein
MIIIATFKVVFNKKYSFGGKLFDLPLSKLSCNHTHYHCPFLPSKSDGGKFW